MNDQPQVGLVTVLYQSDEVLPDFFQSLAIQSFQDYHVYIIDNSANPLTQKLIGDLHDRYPTVNYTYVANSGNRGVAEGNNHGIRLAVDAGCSHTLLLNNDIVFHQENLLHDIYRRALASGDKLIVPKILFYGTGKVWMAGGRLDRWRGSTAHVGGLQDDGLEYSVAGYFNYAPTCFMLIDNALFSEIGMMDPIYFVYFDDTDFVYRATKRGYKVYLMPELVVWHKESASTGGVDSPFFAYYFNRNRLLFIRKNFRGFYKLLALGVTFLANLRKFFLYRKQNRKILLKAIKDGFSIRLSSR